MAAHEIIVALGDTGALARELGLADSRVSNWKTRGIPWRYRPKIAQLARKRKVPLPADFLVET